MFSIRVPATSANLGPGFDSLGIALKLYNSFYFKRINLGIRIELEDEKGNKIQLPLEENLVFKAMKRLFSLLQEPFDGIEIVEKIAFPFACGLGSSATAIVAGFVGANKLLGSPLSEKAILKLATKMEGHPDNIIPAYKGGFTINVMDGEELIFKKLTLNEELKIVLVVPEFRLATKKVRQVLPGKVSYHDAVFNLSRTALLTACLYDNDWEKFSTAMEDRLHQDYRAALIPGFKDIIKGAYKAGALGVALSGAGPAIIAFCQDKAAKIGQVMVDVFSEHNIDSRYIITAPDNKGTMITEE